MKQDRDLDELRVVQPNALVLPQHKLQEFREEHGSHRVEEVFLSLEVFVMRHQGKDVLRIEGVLEFVVGLFKTQSTRNKDLMDRCSVREIQLRLRFTVQAENAENSAFVLVVPVPALATTFFATVGNLERKM